MIFWITLLAFADSPGPVVRCCPGPPEAGVSERCLERLSRGASKEGAACATVSGLGYFTGDSRPPACGQSVIGMQTEAYRQNGWWQDGPPTTETGFKGYPARTLAISSDVCGAEAFKEFPNWEERRKACRTRGYEAAHLYVDLHQKSDPNRIDTAKLAEEDPWSPWVAFRGNVHSANRYSWADLRKKVVELAMKCQIVDYLFLDGHGSPQYLYDKDKQGIPIEGLLAQISPCVLSPTARIQSSGCNISRCRSAAHRVSDEMKKALGPTARFHQGVRFLANTSFGRTAWLGWQDMNPFSGAYSVRSTNGRAMQFTFKNSEVGTDFAINELPEDCTVPEKPED